jgi:hypothetical protein
MAISQRRRQEAEDPVLLARRAGITPDEWQADVLRSPAAQQILLCSRQTGKSTVTAILALFTAIYQARALILILSPTERQSIELLLKLKAVHRSLADAPALLSDAATRMDLDNGSRIIALPGKEQTVRGFSGAALLILDEAARIPDALYYAVRPMLAVSGGRIVLLSTPFGKRGFFHHEWTEGGDDWRRVKITAHDCPRIKPEWLEAERRTIGDWWYSQEYDCAFVETTDQVFRFDDIQAALDPGVKTLEWF